MMTVDKSAPQATYYTVVSGDTLSKISKANYGDPNKIYPGQVLRIPPQ